MSRRIWLVCILALLAVTANAALTITPKSPSKVSGCYQISDAGELYGFAAIVNGTDGFVKDSAACGKLTKDIVVNDNVLAEDGTLNVSDTANFARWIPMGFFAGTFDGQGHTISGLYFNNDTAAYVGLFGLVFSYPDHITEIKNLGVIGSFFRGGADVGSIAGSQVGYSVLTIENVFADSRVEGNYSVGGLLGIIVDSCVVKNSYNLGAVVGNSNVGGLFGSVVGEMVDLYNIYNAGPVTAYCDTVENPEVGGIAGFVTGGMRLENGYNLGPVVGRNYTGGLFGYVVYAISIDKCYNTGDVTGENVVGGIFGELMNTERFSNIYNLGHVSGKYNIGGIVGSLQEAGVFVNVYNAGSVVSETGNMSFVGTIAGYLSYNISTYRFDNVFHLELATEGDKSLGTAVTNEMMADGSVAYRLHNYYYDGVDAAVWGQNVGVDPYPNFSGVVTNISSDAFQDLVLHTFDGDTVTLPQKYLPGYEVLLPMPTYKNKLFLGWYDNAEFSGDAVDVVSETATGTQEFWGKIVDGYSITYETNGGTLDNAAVKVYVQGDSVDLLDPLPRPGYVFRGWYESADFSGNRIRAIGKEEIGDKVFYARWFEKNAPLADGDGCYVITNASELYGFAAIVNGSDGFTWKKYACGKLANDIVVNEDVLTAYGTLNVADTAAFIEWTPMEHFGGKFDGQGHTISGLYFCNEAKDFVGLFGSAIGAEIKNVGVVGSFFRGDDEVGAIVGISEDALTLDSVYSASRVEGAYSGVGGLVGLATGSKRLQIRNSYNLGAVVGKVDVGGLVGYSYVDTTTFVNVYNAGSVSCIGDNDYTYVGGLVGYSSYLLQIQNAYNVGTVAGMRYLGGIVGMASGYNTFVNVYNAGTVLPLYEYAYNVGPIAGYVYVSNYYVFENVFYLDEDQDVEYASAVTGEMVEDGSLAYLLHNSYYDGVDASVWGQNVGKDDYPNFSGVVTDVSSSAFADLVLHTFTGDTTTLPKKYVPGYELQLPEISSEDRPFWGWYDNDEFSGSPVTFVPATATGKQEFWGKFGTVYRITYETDGGELDSSAAKLYVSGKGVPLPKNVSREGYIFTGWFESEDFSEERLFEIGSETTGDKVLYARWFKIETPTEDDDGCYVIKDASELYGFAAIVNGTHGYTRDPGACAYLDDDIVVNENVIDQDGNVNVADSAGFMQWTPINEFIGRFDGQGHAIRGLYFNESAGPSACDNEYGCGFFGSIGVSERTDTVVIENLGIEKSYFAYHDYILGALVGRVVGGYSSAGRVNVRISNCYNTSTVVAESYVGGVVGAIDWYSSVVVENCYNTGAIVAHAGIAGGLVGLVHSYNDMKMTNSFNAGMVLASDSPAWDASLIGDDWSAAVVENSYYLLVNDDDESFGLAVTSEQLENGAVAIALHDGENGSVWGQDVGKDPLPNFSGKVKNSTATQYKVTFHTFDGDTASYFDRYVAGLPRELPKTVARKGYKFSGWYIDSTFVGKSVTSISASDSGDLDFFAYWAAVKYSVRVNSGLGGTVVGLNPSGSYVYGDTINLEAQPFSGYQFSYWGDDLDNVNVNRQVVIVSDTTLNAYFSKISSSSVSSSSGTSSSSSSKGSSSSSDIWSSSSAKSSSSKAKSSSSKKQGSGDGEEPSSSCSGDNCGKDLPIVFELLCDGKKCSDALSAKVAMPQFRVVVVGRDIQVMDARVGSPYALFDLQGGLVRSGQVGNVDFTIPAPHSGSYLVRIGNWTKRVTVR